METIYTLLLMPFEDIMNTTIIMIFRLSIMNSVSAMIKIKQTVIIVIA